MTPERWRHIKEFFYAAPEHPTAERAAFLDAACSGDAGMRREVSQLISAHEEAGGLLDCPAFEAAARSPADGEPEGLAQGQPIGYYKIFASLRAGCVKG